MVAPAANSGEMANSDALNSSRSTSSSAAKHQCADCGIKLTRPSHLARHRASHLPAHQRKHLPCPLCSASFSRNDVLLRHLRITHKSQASPRRNSQKSCRRCIEKKLKCNRTQPCQRCVKADASCYYARQDIEQQPEISYSPQSSLDMSSDRAVAGQDISTEWATFISPQTAGSVDNGYANQGASISTTTSANYTGSDSLNDKNAVDASFSVQNMEEYDVGPSPPHSFYADPSETLFCAPSDQPSAYLAFGGSDFANINLDWLDFGTNSSVDVSNECYMTNEAASPPTLQTQPSASAITELLLNANGNKPSSENALSTYQWPFGQTRDSVPQRCRLPPLQEVLHGAFAPSNPSHNSDALVQILSRPYLPKVSDIQDHATLVAMKTLERSLDAFLNEFNPILPIVHVPTWRIDTCPTVLLAAMASIGAMFADEPGAMAYSHLLSDICNQMIAWLGGSDSTNYHDLAYLSASCLHQIYSLGSGNRQLYQNADRSRGMLMGSLRGMSLLGAQVMVGQTWSSRTETSPPTDTYSLNSDWLCWKKEEQEIRVVWASFEYDCTLSTLTNRRGAVDLVELPTRLPCPEALWEAPSSQAWNALRLHLPKSSMNASLNEALRKTLASGGPDQNADLTPWGKRLCAQVIGRLLWDLKQLQIMSMSSFLGMNSLLKAQRQTKSALLQGLGKLTDSLDSPGSVSELIHYNITGLICHYNYLCTAEDIMDLVVFIARNSIEPRVNNSKYPELDVGQVERRLESLLKVDLRQTRNLAWRAAQIIAIANTYTVSAPCEILRIFMGYAFILAVAKYCPEISSSSIQETAAPVQLDSTSPGESQKKSIMEWIQRGGPAGIATCTDFCTPLGMKCVSEHAQALLHRMRFWGLAEKLKGVLESFHSKDS